jgi:hypothetical protein
MYSLIILLSYYWLITFAIVGYGLLFNGIFIKDDGVDIGYIGIFGIFLLILISYISHFFIPHNQIFNSIVLILGLINLYFDKNNKILQKDIKLLTIVFSVFIIFILTAKNHDDFPYYHFPYTHLITEFSNVLGLGNFNHGFRTHSSIFYLSSFFNLPQSNLFLLNLSPVFFMGFCNLILLNKIKKYLKSNKTDSVFYLSLLTFIFINVFFYRLAEHGTDRSAMILIFILIIELLHLNNQKKSFNENYLSKLFIFITLIISLKPFYILYILLFAPILLLLIKNKVSMFFFIKNKVLYLCLLMTCLLFITNFFNTGCLIYPVQMLCFDNFSWSIPLAEIEIMNNWYQQWSKAGASPIFRVDNPELYIQNFNWVSNWINMYFFNKVSDFLLGLLFLILIVYLTFYTKYKKKNITNKFNFLYLILILLVLEWFYFHPALRYGGYHLIALLLFIPASVLMSRFLINKSKLKIKVYFLIILTLIVFSSRNIFRIHKEYQIYDYDILVMPFHRAGEQNFRIFDKIVNINNCIIKPKNDKCKDTNIELKKMNNFKIYHRKK